jgi:fructose-bisphosphate aldolase class I
LINELKKSMSDSEFDATLAKSVDEIYQASVVKV